VLFAYRSKPGKPPPRFTFRRVALVVATVSGIILGVGLLASKPISNGVSIYRAYTCSEYLLEEQSALNQYAQDFDDKLPPAKGWLGALESHLGTFHRSPSACVEEGIQRIAINGNFMGKSPGEIGVYSVFQVEATSTQPDGVFYNFSDLDTNFNQGFVGTTNGGMDCAAVSTSVLESKLNAEAKGSATGP